MTSADTAVALRSVTVSLRGHVALRGVTLDIMRGDFCGIIGPNGAGKTTLLRVANGLCHIHSGTASILGEPATRANFGRLRRRIGYVTQQERVNPRAPISCLEAVLVGRWGRAGLFRRLTSADRERALSMMELTRTSHLVERPVGLVSGGEARKVALTRALVQEPELLLLDEPLTYRLRTMYLLSALFGVLSCLVGLLVSWLTDAPAGAVIIITSSVLFGLSLLFSPKRRRAGQSGARGQELGVSSYRVGSCRPHSPDS